MLEIGKAIYSILSNDTQLVEKVQNKIYPLVADLGTSIPFIVYKRSGIEPTDTKDCICQKVVYVEVVMASDNYNESVELASLVENALHNKRGTYAGINITDIKLEDADEDFIDDTFIQTLTFKIKTNGRSN